MRYILSTLLILGTCAGAASAQDQDKHTQAEQEPPTSSLG